jgi:Spy/CpxP family protein refolding chaperone
MTARSKRSAALYLGLVFLAGAAFGFSANRLYSTHSAEAKAASGSPSTAREYRRHFINELDEQLNLDEDQASEVMLILDQVGARFIELRDAMEPEFEAIRSERAGRIMDVLTPEQRLRYSNILEEQARARRERDKKWREGS